MNGLNLQQMMQMMGNRGGPRSGPSTPPLVSFKAGRCTATPLGDGSHKVTPVKGKGTLSLTRSGRDDPDGEGMIRVVWSERGANADADKEEKFIVFPGEAKFKQVETGQEEVGQVVMLGYTGGDRRGFWWVQEKEFDEAQVAEVDKLMNDPEAAKKKADPDAPDAPPPSSDPDTSVNTSAVNTSVTNSAALTSALNPAQTPAPAPAAGAPPADGTASPQTLDVQNLQSILSGLGLPPTSSASPSPSGAEGGAAGAGAGPPPAAPAKPPASAAPGGITLSDLQAAMSGAAQPPPSLSHYVTPEEVERQGLLSDPSRVAKLLPLLPPGQRDVDSLRLALRTPQVLSALSSLTEAIDGPDFGSVLANFDLEMGEEERRQVEQGKGVEAFIRACAKKREEEK
mmetsp:Transcript_7983/g.15919  ORF Transcript_7983/g.15919 Transcript_7983/m.15919 type:complete len:398 (+) Transcript_7983:54-1247(+)